MAGKVSLPSFRLGQIEVTPLLDGPLPFSLDRIPDPLQRQEAQRLTAGSAVLAMPVYSFLLRFRDKCVLIDTGSGRLGYDSLGRLPERLEEAGVDPGEVTHILLTHLHRDHYGGMVSGDSAAFPRATLFIHKPEAEFWLDADVSIMPARAQRAVEEVRRVVSLYSDRVRRVGEEEVLDGICALPSPGHTPGHACWQISSEGNKLLAWGDVIHVSQIHLPAPHIAMEYDLDPGMALKTRLAILDWVTANSVIVAGAHLPEPGIWKIVKRDHRCELLPAEVI